MRKDIVLALGVLVLANAMLAQDLAALNVALPGIERELGVDLTTDDAHLASSGMNLETAGRDALQGLLAGAESAQLVIAQFDPAVASELLATATEAFAAGVRAGLRLDAGIAAVGFLVSLLLLRVARRERHEPAPFAPHGTP